MSNTFWQSNGFLLQSLNCRFEKVSSQSLKGYQQGVCHTVALPLTLKSILRQKKNYGNSNISPYKNIIFQKSSKENKILQDILTL
jgi:hypothetical protein